MTRRQFAAEVAGFSDLVTELMRECGYWHRRLGRRSNIARRAYVRASFAFVEGTMYRTKAFLLRVHRPLGVELSSGEIAFLKEEAYGLDDEGRVRVRPQYVSTPANVRFAFAILHRVVRRRPRVDYAGRGWGDFKAAVRIRNRVVHPKRVSDLQIAPSELAVVDRAIGWFRKSHGEFFRLTVGIGGKLFPDTGKP